MRIVLHRGLRFSGSLDELLCADTKSNDTKDTGHASMGLYNWQYSQEDRRLDDEEHRAMTQPYNTKKNRLGLILQPSETPVKTRRSCEKQFDTLPAFSL